MKYHLISAALIVAAVLLFLSGISAARTKFGALLIVAAGVCELKFWGRLLHRPGRPLGPKLRPPTFSE
jgi:hypothetical protein